MTGFDIATQTLFSPLGLIAIVAGTAVGIFVGAIPGLTGTMLLALALPMTYGMDSRLALTLLVAMYVGAISGGMVTATLLRMPGTPASIVTTLDGYPMAQQGKAGRALSLGIMGSVMGGVISWVFLSTLAGPVASVATLLGPFEYFSLVMVALVLISTIGDGSRWRALFAGGLGILFSMPGVASATGQPRMIFGIEALNNGFDLLPVLIGMFAVNQVFQEIFKSGVGAPAVALDQERILPTWSDLKKHAANMGRSAMIGTSIGLLPGIGANIGAVTAYSAAKGVSKNPERFGKGEEAGVVAAETANNATIGGALIPLIALGLPGSVVEVVLLGALVVHGLQPGPRLMHDNPDVVWTITGTVLLANLIMGVLMLTMIRRIARAAQMPKHLLLPVVLAFCVVGAFSLSNRFFDVWVMLGFGAFGLLLERKKFPLAPFVIGFVLGPLAEENLTMGLMGSQGSFQPLLTRPLSLLFLGVAMLVVILPSLRRKKTDQTQAKGSA